jgi:hypothetical protein
MSDGSNGDVGVERGANGHSAAEEPWSPCREHLDCLRGYGLSHNMAVKVSDPVSCSLVRRLHETCFNPQTIDVKAEKQLAS